MPFKTADYVIVGAGSAGCVLANRLSEDGRHTVLVLEAGQRDRNVLFSIPLAARWLWFDQRYNWDYRSEPEPGLGGRTVRVPRGKVLGGSSSINGMIYARGHSGDYDQWRQTGLTGWGYSDVLPYFKRAETNPRGETNYHGAKGPLKVSTYPSENIGLENVVKAAEAAGFNFTDDFHGSSQEGFGPPDMTAHGRFRSSTARTYLRPALRRPNLEVLTGALAEGLYYEAGRVAGLKFRLGGKSRLVCARKEVILSGGAINSPQLLMLSGIGDGVALRELDIPVVCERKAVGKNLQDHLAVNVRCASSRELSFERQLRLDRLSLQALRWLIHGSGPLTGLPLSAMAFIRTRPELARPDIQYLIAPVAPEAGPWLPGVRQPIGPQLVFRTIGLHPESTGHLDLVSGDPADPVRITHSYLSQINDVITLREGIKAARRVLAEPPLADQLGVELEPGREIQSDEEIDTFVRETAGTIFHPVGTCRMGVDADSVVDGELRVRGIDGLRVVDASVMPCVTGGNTNAPTIMIAEKAADMIMGKVPLPAADL
ncbi:MAG: GMC family oxidoreductase N-terminal domain-containing protein [Rhodospirillales bacterium]|nr:GMC family oxidoreductase N-terminal domain-containing protein [Rhodospirillales bacterium]